MITYSARYVERLVYGEDGADDPMLGTCPDCRAQPGQECYVDCSSRWDAS